MFEHWQSSLKKLLCILLTVAFFHSNLLHAWPGCLAVTLQALEPRHKNLLTELDKTNIQKIMFDKTLEKEQQGEMAFKVFFEAQLRGLPDKVIESVRIIEKNAFTRKADFFNGFYCLLNNTMCVQVPKDLVRSLIAYAIRAHEVEHAIQTKYTQLETQEPRFWERYYWGYRSGYQHIQDKFLEEQQAMKAEWAFLDALPESTKLELLDELESFDVPGAAMVKSWLKQNNQSAEAHLYTQYQQGRYTRDAVVDMLAEQGITYKPNAGFFFNIAAGAATVLIVTCIAAKDLAKRDVCAEFIQKSKANKP